MIFAKNPPPPDDDPITADMVFELTDEAKVKMTAFLDALSNVVDHTVTGDDLAAALKSLRQNEGLAFDLRRADHMSILVARLKDMKDGAA